MPLAMFNSYAQNCPMPNSFAIFLKVFKGVAWYAEDVLKGMGKCQKVQRVHYSYYVLKGMGKCPKVRRVHKLYISYNLNKCL